MLKIVIWIIIYLEQFTQYKGDSNNKINNINIVASKNSVVPDFEKWVSSNSYIDIGQIFLSLKNNNRIYYLLTNYDALSNEYIIPYITSGTYTENFWAATKTPLSTNEEYSIAPFATSQITIN